MSIFSFCIVDTVSKPVVAADRLWHRLFQKRTVLYDPSKLYTSIYNKIAGLENCSRRY